MRDEKEKRKYCAAAASPPSHGGQVRNPTETAPNERCVASPKAEATSCIMSTVLV